MKIEFMDNKKIYQILLLTNRDSDNVGDQVIEACDISLIQTVMKNLGVQDYKINSRAAGIISQKYLESRDEELLINAQEAISGSDIIIFGGAPLFNYAYQTFYERTAVTLEIAQKYNKPVIFSAIGIEGYDDENEKCQRLKKTLNFDCVKQITTRDGYDFLKNYKEKETLIIGKVSDPAVFSSSVFSKYIEKKENKIRKKIGVFILRSNGFTDNKVDFTREDAAKLWVELVEELQSRGYDYELLTSGHFGDEAFLDYLIKHCGVSAEHCVFNMNCPERLIRKISSYDSILSCRLHPSIISFSLGVPSLGVVWNSKVKHFYNSIGYSDRLVDVQGINAQNIVDRLEKIMNQGVKKDEEYLATVYTTLYEGIKNIICQNALSTCYKYEEIIENIVYYSGTSEKELEEKTKRKFRRTYGKYNDLFEKNIQNKLEIKKLRVSAKGYTIVYNSGVKSDKLTWDYDGAKGSVEKLATGSVEYRLRDSVLNGSGAKLEKNLFRYPEHKFLGWRMRIKNIHEMWYWLMPDEKLVSVDEYDNKKDGERLLIKDRAEIPYIPEEYIVTVVLEGVWKKNLQTRVKRKIRKIRGKK